MYVWLVYVTCLYLSIYVLSCGGKREKKEDNMVPKGSLNTGNLGTVSYLETEKSFGQRSSN
jgi:hypothetical protein